MSSIDSFYSNALVGLTSSQQALSIISNNISNAATPGYTRELPTAVPVGGVSSSYNLIAQRQTSIYVNAGVQTAQSSASANTSYYQQVSQLSTVLASSSTDIGNSLQSFFTSIQKVAADPAAIPPRQQLLNNAQTVVSAFQGVGGQLAQLAATTNAQISGDVTAINSLSTQLAKQNAAIALAEAGGNGATPNDLLDQRDQTLQSLSKLVSVSTVSQTDGSLNVFIGTGQSLVVGGTSQKLTVVPSATDSSQLHVAYDMAGQGGAVALTDSSLTGGDLGATLQFRSESLDPATRNLSQLASTFAAAVNNQHALGVDLAGVTGGNFFNLPPMAVQAAAGNAGGAVLTATVGNPAAMQASDYQLGFDGSNYTLKSLQDSSTGLTLAAPKTVYTGASLPSADQFGINFNLSGPMAAGDSFTVKPYQTTLTSLTVAITDPAKIGAASQFSITPDSLVGSNTSMTVGGIDSTTLATAQFPAKITFQANGAYTIDSAAGSGVAQASGTLTLNNGVPQPISFNGLTLRLTAVPASGNTFTLAINQGGAGSGSGSGLSSAGNNENASALSALQTLGLVSTGTGSAFSLSAQYSRVVGVVGSQAAVAKATSASADGVLRNLQAQQQSISGVNLDEEAANLLKYQQQYQAAAKVMQVASTLFQALLQI